jgi:DNA recombination protein RmuC
VAIEQMLTPFRETLTRYEQGLRRLELDRQEAYAQLTTKVGALGATQEQLQRETRNLVAALRSPQTRGRWGEIQLRRVVELAGMVAHCDFSEQVTVQSEDGRLRPDLVVHLPGGANVVVDSKVALDAYLSAVECAEDDERAAHLVTHARQLRTHVDQLAKKEYWSQFDATPELVVAFIPGDSLLAAASEQDPGLVEHALAHHVHLATPTTLIALLRTIAYSWRQEDMAANARDVQQMGAELYDRLRVMGGHLTKLHRHLSGTVDAYNETVGSLESRVLVTARRFPEMGVGVGGKDLPEMLPVTAAPRLLQAPELSAGAEDDTDGEGGGGPEVSELHADADAVIRRLTGSG